MIFGGFGGEIVFLKRVVTSQEVRRNEGFMCLTIRI